MTTTIIIYKMKEGDQSELSYYARSKPGGAYAIGTH